MRNLSKVNAEYISNCSPRHIQSVIEDLLQVIQKQSELADEVIKLEPFKEQLGYDRLNKLLELAANIHWKEN